ncbi:MAG: cytochrome b/b6 domain-containing protein [Firmicutes bacterium]|nr:cytochrome b/b6 domain-containing protein [Bacillota bacterium]
MKMKNIVKIILDLVMFALFAALLFADDAGLAFHEIMGLSVLVLVILHLSLNIPWIVNVTKKLIGKSSQAKASWMYLLNIVLFIGMVIIITTGLMISTVILSHQGYSPALAQVHQITAYITGSLFLLHIALHLKYLKITAKNIFRSFKTPVTRRTISGALAILLLLGIFYYNLIATLNKNIYSDALNKLNSQKEKVTQITSEQPATISLPEFLGTLFCTYCEKNCPLSNPQCKKSENLIIAAQAEYQRLYSNGNAQPTIEIPDSSQKYVPGNVQEEQPQYRNNQNKHLRRHRGN